VISFLKKSFHYSLQHLQEKRSSHTVIVLIDFLAGLLFWRIWYMMGMKDIKLRYKRSKIGQLWHTLTTAIQIIFTGLIWAYLFHMPISEYFPYLAIGKIYFDWMNLIISNGAKYYYTEKNTMLELPSPKSIYAYSNTFKSFILFLHNFVVIIAVMIFFKHPINSNLIFLLPAIILVLLNSIWITVIIGYIGARFRDIPNLIDSLLGIVLMLTPIMWKVEQLPERVHKYLLLNPFNIFITINRDAILGYPPNFTYWFIAMLITVIGFLITIIFLRKYLYRISFWV
jgi:ABC-type polysaccharide/polyol phosphate export permease